MPLPPISSVGLRMDDSCLRIAVGLHLGTSICAPHIANTVVPRCLHSVYMASTAGLVLAYETLCSQRHHTLLSLSCWSPLRLDPPGLLLSDGKRPDGMTLVPFLAVRSSASLLSQTLYRLVRARTEGSGLVTCAHAFGDFPLDSWGTVLRSVLLGSCVFFTLP